MFSEPAQRQLERWGMSIETAEQAGLFSVDDVANYYPAMKHGPAIMIPYFKPSGSQVLMRDGTPFARVRRITPDEVEVKGFTKRKVIRYTQPSGMGPQVYFPQNGPDWQAVQLDPTIGIAITEGEAKAIMASTYDFNTIGLGGVYNFTTPGGQLLPELEQFVWEQRDVFIVFDSDAATNPQVLTAEARLIDELQLRRNARCHIVRLPSPRPDVKIGMDDFLRDYGPEALEQLAAGAQPLTQLDAKVIGMNKNYAWIDKERMVFDFRSDDLVPKADFLSGNLSSTEKAIVPGQKGSKVILVADAFLKHPHAQRYTELLFRPSEGLVVAGRAGPALNRWRGWGDLEEGDVGPFLRLNEFLFHKQPEHLRDLALKLVIYKAQNPSVKIPLAIVLIGEQGTGKTVWADSIRDAFAPYSANPNPHTLAGEFEGWLEMTLLATIHEMTPEDLRRNSEKMKALISDPTRPMNEKYRVAREVQYYGFHIISSNYVGVGAYADNDRRMCVFNTPKFGPEQMYTDVWNWKMAGGGKKLLTWMLNYDLQGWVPPQRAPMTAAKAMASMEAMTPIERIAVDMRTADQPMIVRWLDMSAGWAQNAELSNNTAMANLARMITQQVKTFQIRPWYTPDELSMMLPNIVENLMGSKHQLSTPSGALSSQLRNAGIPHLINLDDPRGFQHQGQIKQYLVVADFAAWEDGITQATFDKYMREWPTYGQIKGARR